MCRGSRIRFAVLLEDLLFKPENSLVVQSKHSRLGAETTNGDGFGVGWYGAQETPGIFRSTEPAWNDRNLRELSAHASVAVGSSRTSARRPGRRCSRPTATRSATGAGCGCTTGPSPDFRDLKRDLVLAVDPELFPDIEGSTDSEMLFYLALTFGLEDDPPAAVARAVGLVEETGRRHGVERPDADDGRHHRRRDHVGVPLLQRGQVPVAVPQHRRRPRCGTSTRTTRVLHELSDDARLVVSEPLGDLRGAWREVPEGSWGMVRRGEHEVQTFEPITDS